MLLKFREARGFHWCLGSLGRSLQSPGNKDADLVFVTIRLKVCPVNCDSTSNKNAWDFWSLGTESYRNCCYWDYLKTVLKLPQKRLCIADICRFGLKATYFLYLRLPHWSGARGQPASHPDRPTDLPPLLLAPCHRWGATSPLPAPLEKNTEQRELILLQEKKGPFIQEANCRSPWSRGKKNPKHPRNYSSASPLFLCGKTERFHILLESYCFYKKGKTGA